MFVCVYLIQIYIYVCVRAYYIRICVCNEILTIYCLRFGFLCLMAYQLFVGYLMPEPFS